MYIDSVAFQPVTNREDFYQTPSLYDDDFATAINLTGVTRANPGIVFTAAAWNVADGAIATTSASPITIPALPYTSQLLALPLTVAPGLGILAGDFVTITDTATGANTLQGYVQSYAPSTGAMVVQIGWSFEFEIRRPRRPLIGQDYTTWWDFGSPNADDAIIKAALGTGISFIEINTVSILVPASVMRQLPNKTYLAAMTMTDSVNTRQLFVGALPVLYGGTT